MIDNPASRSLIVLLRLSMAWIFLYAASQQVFVPDWSVASFLGSTKTFHGLFALFTGPAVTPVISFLVSWGHLLIGLSLLAGLLVRVSSVFGIALMLAYWMAHMDFPYIGDTNYFLVDVHIVNALVLGLLIVTHAGHVWGLDALAAQQSGVRDHKWFAWATA